MFSAPWDLSLRLVGSLAVVHGLRGMWGPAMDPASPALQGGFLTTSEVPSVCSEETVPVDETNLVWLTR